MQVGMGSRARALLASTAFTGVFIAVIAGHPNSALAACSGVNTGNVLCDASNQAATGTLTTTFGGTTVVNVNNGGKIDTGGARATVTAPGDLTFNNNDTTFGITNTGSNLLSGVRLSNDFGSITYLGNANVTAMVAPSAAITAGIGAGAGNISITNNATVTGPDFGIAVSHSGAGSMLVTGTGNVTGSTAIQAIHSGVGPAAGTNGIALTGSGNVNGIGGFGLFAQIFNGANASNILIDRSGTVSGGFNSGIFAQTTGTGNVTVTGSASVTGLDTFTNLPVNGITAIQTNSTAGTNGSVTVGGSGNVSATGIGIQASVSGANNKGNVTVTRTGNVTAAGIGILAAADGGGDVTVSGVGNVTSSGAGSIGIQAQAAGGNGNVVVAPAGAITATTIGISVSTAGTGTSTVTVANNITSGTGVAVSGGGDINITQTSGTVTAGGSALQAVSSGGAGAINITTAAGTAASGAITLLAHQFGTGDVNVMSGGTVTAINDGIQARIFGGTSTGNTTVNVTSGSITADFHGIFAQAAVGKVNVTVAAGATVTGGTNSWGVAAFGGSTTVVTNSGTIKGSSGGVQTNGGSATVTNFGSIAGSSGTAVRLSGANNTFIMSGPNATLSGKALGGGADTFRFDGSGSNAFDVSQIGTGWTLIDKTGSSNWTLNGTSTTTAALTVNGGTLSLNGNLTSASGVTVNSGGTLGGNGTVGNTTINSGGALAPGNSIGTITINGTLIFGAGGIYRVEVAGTASDKTIVTGTATLGSAAVQVVPTARVTTRTTYTILTAAPVSGTFGSATVVNNFARNPLVTYAGNDVLLTLDPGLLTPVLAGATPNQRSVAAGIDNAIGSGNPMTGFDALFALSSPALNNALDQLSGEVHASTVGVLADESLYARSAILGRLRQASYGNMASMAALKLGGPQTAFADDGGEAIESALAYAKSPIVTKAPIKAPVASPDVVFWAQGFGAWGRFNGDGNATSVRRDLAGFITGIDTRVGGNGRLGIAAGYTGSKNALDGRGSSNVETAHIAGYGGWSFGAVNLRAGGAYAFHSIDTDRTVAFVGFADRLTARYDGGTGQLFGELGYGFALGNLAVEPFAGAAWVRVHTDAAAERGGLAALNVASTTFETGYTTLGIRAASMIALSDSMMLIPRASLAWQHAFDSITPAATLAFQVAPTSSFVISGVPIARDALLAEAGLDLAIGRNATVGVSYTGQVSSNVQDHAAKGKFLWKF